jgi:hypothetical protein
MCFNLADPGAAIARNAIAVVAFFGILIDHTVAAGRTRGYHLARPGWVVAQARVARRASFARTAAGTGDAEDASISATTPAAALAITSRWVAPRRRRHFAPRTSDDDRCCSE